MDTMKKQSKKRAAAALIRPLLRGTGRLFAGAVVFSLLNTVLSAALPQIIRVAVDSVFAGRPLPGRLGKLLAPVLADPARALLLAAGATLLTAALAGLCSYLGQMGIARGSEAFVKSLRDRLFEHIQKLPFSWHSRNQTGEIIQRCTSDVEVIRQFVSTQLLQVFRIVFLVAVSLGAMFSMDRKISLIACAFLPAVGAYSCVFHFKIARRFRTADEAEGQLSADVQENLTGVRVVRAFGRERFEIGRFDRLNERFSRLWIRLGSLLSLYWGTSDLIIGLQVLTVTVAGIAETVGGGITLGEFLAFVFYNSTLAWPIRSLGRVLSEMSKAGVSAERVAEILAAEEEKDPPGALEPPMDGDIAFRHVTFGYGGQEPVLKDVDFTIPAGSTFAVLGGTGSGKSTLAHLLDRLYELPPECGSITVGGVGISKIKLSHLRRNVGIVLQEPFLFSRTILENIRAARPGATREEVRRAARAACVDGDIEAFADGYDTMVGERGVTLSGGQKQRVAIARMLLQRAPILIFDDSLSAVDAETDARIRAALRQSLGGATVILISHRITTLMQADRILVLDRGKVAELGTHEELVRRDGIYRKIYEIQMNGADRALLREGEARDGV
jgi:ATP-binding cassette subfamily B protein